MIFITKYNFIKTWKIFWVLICLTVFLLVAYVGLIALTVSDIVIHDRVQGNLAKLAAEVTALEEEYLELSGGVSFSQARALGFVDARKTYFLKSTGELLTARTNADNRQ